MIENQKEFPFFLTSASPLKTTFTYFLVLIKPNMKISRGQQSRGLRLHYNLRSAYAVELYDSFPTSLNVSPEAKTYIPRLRINAQQLPATMTVTTAAGESGRPRAAHSILFRFENLEELFFVPAAKAVIKYSSVDNVVLFDGFDVDVGIICKVSASGILLTFLASSSTKVLPEYKVLSSAPYATASADLSGAYLNPGLTRMKEWEDYRGPTDIGEVLGMWADNANVSERQYPESDLLLTCFMG